MIRLKIRPGDQCVVREAVQLRDVPGKPRHLLVIEKQEFHSDSLERLDHRLDARISALSFAVHIEVKRVAVSRPGLDVCEIYPVL